MYLPEVFSYHSPEPTRSPSSSSSSAPSSYVASGAAGAVAAALVLAVVIFLVVRRRRNTSRRLSIASADKDSHSEDKDKAHGLDPNFPNMVRSHAWFDSLQR